MRPGITPACAGRTIRIAKIESSTKDHPRVCGKNGITGKGYELARGSPPRVREEQ
ncbi:hypothetical protein HMPREF0889_0190 [Megasphaera lornae]|uniref:Uncharacterized protein n=1 Tax=Megasphaera lornae TaxID=1000568 RepID=D3LV71_9FIRM|nr:hypothetical protein HMPREF0889_0190 [Megasphaera genomosp. type_1 str. 28L]